MPVTGRAQRLEAALEDAEARLAVAVGARDRDRAALEDVQREASTMLKHCEEVEAARVEAARRLAELETSSTALTERVDAREAALAVAEATKADALAGTALQTQAVADLSGKLAAAKAQARAQAEALETTCAREAATQRRCADLEAAAADVAAARALGRADVSRERDEAEGRCAAAEERATELEGAVASLRRERDVLRGVGPGAGVLRTGGPAGRGRAARRRGTVARARRVAIGTSGRAFGCRGAGPKAGGVAAVQRDRPRLGIIGGGGGRR